MILSHINTKKHLYVKDVSLVVKNEETDLALGMSVRTLPYENHTSVEEGKTLKRKSSLGSRPGPLLLGSMVDP
ncbi:MAG: hypothetical protein JSC188_000424 [Candidatus Tokpelaia sp. JSC188]|nr:MAG: hypothetical protein JSC188_000424 [Candidatus Tokpelaia sp. JSC188]